MSSNDRLHAIISGMRDVERAYREEEKPYTWSPADERTLVEGGPAVDRIMNLDQRGSIEDTASPADAADIARLAEIAKQVRPRED